MAAEVEVVPQALPAAGWSYELTRGTLESLPELPGWSYEQEIQGGVPDYDDRRDRRGPAPTPYCLLVPCQVAGVADADSAQPKVLGGTFPMPAIPTASSLDPWTVPKTEQPAPRGHGETTPGTTGTPSIHGDRILGDVRETAQHEDEEGFGFARREIPPVQVEPPGAGARSRGETSDTDTATPETSPTCSLLLRLAELASCGVRRWDPGQYVPVERLQDAETNHGVVELMLALHRGGMKVAVKRMPTAWVRHGPAEFSSRHRGSEEQPWNDLGITKYLHGIGFPFACDLHGVFRDRLTTYVVSSFATEGDLLTWVDRLGCAGRELEVRAKPIVIQVFFAVWWLHELGIAHRDLSLENILLTKQGGNHLVKIIDFGAATDSRHCGEGESRGKPAYQAPEMHAGGYDALAADSFALGVVLFSTMAHDFPWTSTAPGACKRYSYSQRNGLRALLKARHARTQRSRRLIEVLSPTLVDAIGGLLQADPDARLNLGEACRADHGQASFWDTPWAQEPSVSWGEVDRF